MTTHPYLTYAKALLMSKHNLKAEKDIKAEDILDEIKFCLKHYALTPSSKNTTEKKVKYRFTEEETNIKAPNYIHKNVKGALENISNKGKMKFPISVIPFSGEFNGFSAKGMNERCKPNWSAEEYKLGCITSATPDKPCLSDNSRTNWCLIPDLDLPDMILFVDLFREMKDCNTKNLMIGKLIKKKMGNSFFTQPGLIRGNFPNAPQNSAMGAIALLGAIGEFAKDAKEKLSPEVCNVVKRLKDSCMYVVSSKEIRVVSFNSAIVDLASEGELNSIVKGVDRIELFRFGNQLKKEKDQKDENTKKIDYQKLDLFASRFLQLFNRATFIGFLSFRAEYPMELKLLLKKYFCYMEKIDEEIVISAMALGQWLNAQAYHYAESQVKKTGNSDDDKDKEKIREIKVKALVQIENSIMSARNGCDLIRYAPEVAHRLTGWDICEPASLFMQKVSAGELPLEQAKNLLIAFSRLKSTSDYNKKN